MARMRAGAATAEERLLDAAGRLFVERGYAAIGIRQIAKEAGLTIGALYHYADSKEALFLRVLDRGYTAATTSIAAATNREGPPVDRLRRLVRAQLEGEVSDRDLWRLTRAELDSLSPAARKEVVRLRDDFEAVWAEVIQAGIDDDSFDPIDPSIARLTLITMCSSVADWFRPDGRLTLDEIAAVVADQALLALRARTT